MSRVNMARIATPVLGRSKTANIKTPKSMKGKSNGSILNFFKKSDTADSPEIATKLEGREEEEEEESLFIGDEVKDELEKEPYQNPTPPKEDDYRRYQVAESFNTPVSDELDKRFNENAHSVKRRKTDDNQTTSPSPPTLEKPESSRNDATRSSFPNELIVEKSETRDGITRDKSVERVRVNDKEDYSISTPHAIPALPAIPALKVEETSISEKLDFEGMGDFADEEFYEEGEEFLERRWMEEQAEFEADFEADRDGETPHDAGYEAQIEAEPSLDAKPVVSDPTPSCPICSAELVDITDQEASIHVNNCLDGKPTPLPVRSPVEKSTSSPALKKEDSGPSHKRFQRSAIARPGQQNPFALGSSNGKTNAGSPSAFSTIMSGHAEDAAWAEAASNELASRGKPAYKRTCPFYKIMPGLFICVDAFRYGAVEGCNAYFLSHFHSDHYIGLTSSWCHGPIYCSHVTGNLVRQQLRVDPKWVFDLDFDKTMEVPNTQGVKVTMIPANHCPGSSLYLFEKQLTRGKTPKIQRILHCGDFRACPAHVQHPLLRPNLVDPLTKRSIGQQKLDVCYLDTTYLTPKYAFPTQEDVIQACSDMCVSLSKDFIDENDSWEQTVRERAGSGMVKFVRQASSTIKQEVSTSDPTATTGDHNEVQEQAEDTKPQKRGRLLVICGTYSIGKERICLGIARALNSKIYAPPSKLRVVAALEDPELSARMTADPLEAQVHMQMLMEIRAETLADYLTGYKPHFSRIVGFRPSGWNYRPPNSRFTDSPLVNTVLNSENWKSRYSMGELVPQRGSTRESSCFGVPYSEHSSFRELTMFVCSLRIDKIVPTVNVGSAKSRERMKGWCDKWAAEKKRVGLWRVEEGQVAW